MPFDIDALCERLGSHRITETFTDDYSVTEIASDRIAFRTLSMTDISKVFGNIQLPDTEHVAFIPTRMCHSLPNINKRGRCFFPSVMKRSAPTAQDSLVNLEHILKRNKQSEDKVIGHVRAISFDPESIWDGKVFEEVASTGVAIAGSPSNQRLLIPSKAIPLYALMAIQLRTEAGKDIVEQLSSGKRRWKTSMECVAYPTKCGFLYENQFIHVANADAEMLECVEKNNVKPYKGKKLSLCLGGIDDTVDFCGIGCTTSPADTDSDVLGLFANVQAQTASVQRSMPIRSIRIGFPQEKREEAIELASLQVEKILEEQAALTVIGQTEESDGHRHDVLSDGTCLPYEGHSHGVESIQLVTGTNPRFTAKTGTNERYMPMVEAGVRYYIHSHLIDIALKGKRKATETPTDETASSEDDEALSSEEIMKLKDHIKGLEDKITALGATPTVVELNSVRDELRKLRTSEEIATAVEEAIEAKLSSGDLVKKEEVEKKVSDAEKLAKDKADAELKEKEAAMRKQQQRLADVTALGVDVEAIEDGFTKSIREMIMEIPTDERGDREFAAELRRHKTLVTVAKKEQEAQNRPAEKEETVTQQANVKKPYLLQTSSGGNGKGGGSGAPAGPTVQLPAHFATKRNKATA